jgi:hypothetical protein
MSDYLRCLAVLPVRVGVFVDLHRLETKFPKAHCVH